MTPRQAKEVLLVYRPGADDAREPEVLEALDLARRDAELARWLDQHRSFQQAVSAKLRQVSPPPHLKDMILAQRKVVRPVFRWRSPVALAAAALFLAVLGLASLWVKPSRPDRFTDFRAWMVSTALREYQMDLVTNDMVQLRRFLSTGGAPADYQVPGGLERLALTGGGLLRWRTKPVSMVCFNRGDNQMLFLFVMDRSALQDPPPEIPRLTKVSLLQTASWTHGGKTYVLAGPEEADFLQKYL